MRGRLAVDNNRAITMEAVTEINKKKKGKPIKIFLGFALSLITACIINVLVFGEKVNVYLIPYSAPMAILSPHSNYSNLHIPWRTC